MEGAGAHYQRQIGLIENRLSMALGHLPGLSGEDGRSHPGVVHTGNGQAHDDRGNEFLPAVRRSKNPVMLPPGRAKLATKPSATGADAPQKTMGIVRVSRASGASCATA
jgi:hypothetical protein